MRRLTSGSVIAAAAQVATLALLLAALAGARLALAIQPERPGQETFIISAVHADGALWLLSDAGVVSSLERNPDRLRREALDEPAFALCVQDDQPTALTGDRDNTGDWTLRQRRAGRWRDMATIRRAKDYPLALSCDDAHITVLTSARLIDIGPAGRHITPLSGGAVRGPITTIFRTADNLYVGMDAGEWGGGLEQIARATGEVHKIERKDGDAACEGPLNAACDPVNGIVADPSRPGCVVVAIGLIHFLPSGRLLRVCGDKVEQIYAKPYKPAPSSDGSETLSSASDTVAFFGLARDGDAIWAAGMDGVYRFESAAAPRFIAMPEFHSVGGIQVSYDIPGLALIVTEANSRQSVSDGAPLLVTLPRPAGGPLAPR